MFGIADMTRSVRARPAVAGGPVRHLPIGGALVSTEITGGANWDGGNEAAKASLR